jgi:primary-amine oxidase
MRSIVKLLCALLALAFGSISGHAEACFGGADTLITTINRTFSAGSSWSIQVYKAPCEGLVIANALYAPLGLPAAKVLTRASVSEIHVPYDNNAARYLDVTVDGSGLGNDALVLTAAECDGTLYDGGRICIGNEDGDFGWKSAGAFRIKQRVQMFMASQVGAYVYIFKWTFHDDGTIEPEVGLTGGLQLASSTPPDIDFGSRLNAESLSTPRIGLNHHHNIYYRLDFAINGSGNDAVDRLAFSPYQAASGPCAQQGACGKTTRTPILTEAAQSWLASESTSWFVYDKLVANADGRSRGYEIRPHLTGTYRGRVNNDEPWSNGELYVTRFDSCERLAARNLEFYLPPSCTGNTPPANLSEMVADGQSVSNQDVVVWYALRHHHVVRDEDEVMMPIEWDGFEIAPRSFAASNPAP